MGKDYNIEFNFRGSLVFIAPYLMDDIGIKPPEG